MIPSTREMPRITVRFEDALGVWLIPLPDGTTRTARSVSEVEAIVAAHASGASVKFYRATPLTEGELREMYGGR